MAEDSSPAPKPAPPVEGTPQEIAKLAADPAAAKPVKVSDKEWRKHRMAAGNMVVIRSHFKSIYLIPMALISLICGIADSFASSTGGNTTLGLIWIVAFALYMNIFIFEWSRPWTFGFFFVVVAFIAIGFAVNSPNFPVWGTLKNFISDLNFTFSQATYFFFAIFFGICVLISFIKTRLSFVVVESNEVQIYRNSLFGDRERVSMLNPRVEVRVPDMLEYFHPFYGAGQILIHAPDRSIVLDNVLHIRRIERSTDRLGSALSVRVSE